MRSLFTFICLIQGALFAGFVEVSTMEEVMGYFKGKDKETLGVFDLDLVLVQSGEAAFQIPNEKRYASTLNKMKEGLSVEEKDVMYTYINTETATILVDPNAPKCLKELAERGIPLIGLSCSLTGKFGAIEHLEIWKAERLKKLGIDFSKMAPYQKEIVFKNLSTFRGNEPIYTQGIVFGNGPHCSKGRLLITFLESAKIYPGTVIFVDDLEKNLASVEEALHAWNRYIYYQPLLFVGAKNYPAKEVSEPVFKEKWEKVIEEAKRESRVETPS